MHYINKEKLEEVIRENGIFGNKITEYILAQLLSCLKEDCAQPAQRLCEHRTGTNGKCDNCDYQARVEPEIFKGTMEALDKITVRDVTGVKPVGVIEERDRYRKALKDISNMYSGRYTASYMRDIADQALGNL